MENNGQNSSIKAAVLTFMTIANIGGYVSMGFPAFMNIQLTNYLDMDSEQFNYLYCIISIPNIFMPILLGSLMPKYISSRGIFITTNFLIMLGQFICCLGIYERKYYILFYGRLIYGLGYNNLNIGKYALNYRWFDKNEMSRVSYLPSAIGRLCVVGSVQFFSMYQNSPPDIMYTPVLYTCYVCLVSFMSALVVTYIDIYLYADPQQQPQISNQYIQQIDENEELQQQQEDGEQPVDVANLNINFDNISNPPSRNPSYIPQSQNNLNANRIGSQRNPIYDQQLSYSDESNSEQEELARLNQNDKFYWIKQLIQNTIQQIREQQGQAWFIMSLTSIGCMLQYPYITNIQSLLYRHYDVYGSVVKYIQMIPFMSIIFVGYVASYLIDKKQSKRIKFYFISSFCGITAYGVALFKASDNPYILNFQIFYPSICLGIFLSIFDVIEQSCLTLIVRKDIDRNFINKIDIAFLNLSSYLGNYITGIILNNKENGYQLLCLFLLGLSIIFLLIALQLYRLDKQKAGKLSKNKQRDIPQRNESWMKYTKKKPNNSQKV